MKTLLSTLFLIFFSTHSLWGQSLSPKQRRQLDRLLTEQVQGEAPGLALGVVQAGQLVYEGFAGLADLKKKLPIDSATRFNIASNAKQFTALCILKLAAEGKLKLSDDIRQYVPGLLPGIKMPIALSHLINHASGIRDVYNLWSMQGFTWWKKTFNNQDALALLMQQQELNFPPGSAHLYSNSNYILLAQVVEKASGQSFEAYSTILFQQLGMFQTRFEDDHEAIGEMALPYGGWKKW